MTRQSLILILAIGGALTDGAWAVEPEVDPAELPRIPAVEPEDAVDTFELREGFALRLAACEPEVKDPIAITFDADGRLFVVEMRDYPERREEALGRIRLLEDRDGDGVYETSTVFADSLKWPTSVTCYDGGVFAVVTPDILYLKDTDGDGVADTCEVAFTGLAFGVPVEKWNMEGLANGLQWGPDNRIWGSSSTSGGKLHRVGQGSAGAIDLGGCDFSFDPKTRELRAENGGGQNGMGFDAYGRRYLTSNSRHLMAVMWEKAWNPAEQNGALPAALVSIAVDGDAAPVFRISPDEPWRIVRTRWRVAGVVGGPVEGGGRVSGYFTGASGVTIYNGDAYGAGFTGNAFIADVGSNLVHRKILRQSSGGRGVAMEAARPEDERDREFLASRDNWFRPTNFANAPDGCLYVVDMYREVIEHPWSLPESIKKHLDLYAGTERGRIYRIEPEAFERRTPPRLSALTNDALAALLGHANGWHRETAQRVLWERGDKRAGAGWARIPEPGSPFGRFRALLARRAERGGNPWRESAKLAEVEPRDPWLDAALLNRLVDPADAAALWGEVVVRRQSGASLRVPLAHQIGHTGGIEDVRTVLENDPARGLPPERVRVAAALAGGLVESGHWSAEARRMFSELGFPALALSVARDPEAGEGARTAAVRLAGNLGFAGEMVAFLGEGQPMAVRLAVLETLSGSERGNYSKAVLGAWGSMESRLRAAAFAILRAEDGGKGLLALMEAIEAGGIEVDTLPPGALATLREHRELEVRRMAARVLPDAGAETRQAVIARFAGALTLPGDSKRGAALYGQFCSGCHRAGGKGFAAGPDMESFKGAGRESILTSILDPNLQVAPQFVAYTVELHGGDVQAGILARETTTELTVRQPFGIERTIPRSEVAGMRSAGRSLMPEGLEGAFTPEAMADLLAYVESL